MSSIHSSFFTLSTKSRLSFWCISALLWSELIKKEGSVSYLIKFLYSLQPNRSALFLKIFDWVWLILSFSLPSTSSYYYFYFKIVFSSCSFPRFSLLFDSMNRVMSCLSASSSYKDWYRVFLRSCAFKSILLVSFCRTLFVYSTLNICFF